MRVVLTPAHLATQAGKELLEIAVRVTLDGKLDADEIKSLYGWCKANKATSDIPAIGYLHDIITRVAADKFIDRDELMELHLAIERVIPTSFRGGVKEARKSEEAARKDREREKQRLAREEEKARKKEERDRARAEEKERRERLWHIFTKVSGVSFPNDDGIERQEIIRHCRRGEVLRLIHDPTNRYSPFAIKVLRQTGQQIGHIPEQWAEQVCELMQDGCDVSAQITNVTGGTYGKEYRGVNVAVFFAKRTVTNGEYDAYVAGVMSRA
jgi:hypothetical protein